MSNSISLASKFVAFIDQVYRAESKTALLDPVTQAPDFLAANEVKVMKLSTVGLGNYSRTEGYPAGDITATWETLQLAAERGRAFTVDRMDDEETLGQLVGALIAEWMRTNVAPELDAYRFAKYASGAGNYASAATLSTAEDVLAAIDAGNLALSEDGVPGLAEQLQKIRQDNDFLFEGSAPPTSPGTGERMPTNSEMIHEIATSVAVIKDTVMRLDKAVMGNGKPGLVERVKCIEMVHEQQAAEEQKQRAQRERLSGRAWAVLLVLITQAVGLVVLFIRTGSIR